LPEVDEDDLAEAVSVPRISCPLSDEDYLELTMEHNPLPRVMHLALKYISKL